MEKGGRKGGEVKWKGKEEEEGEEDREKVEEVRGWYNVRIINLHYIHL